MKHTKLVSFSVLCLLFVFTSCGRNPHIVDEITSEVGGNDTINPGPPTDPEDPPPTPTPPPSARLVTLGARDYDPSEEVKASVTLPYRTKKVKHIGFGRSMGGLMCRLFGDDNCVHDKQVLFAFDIPALGEIRKLHDVRLQANFITYGLSFDTELLCLNNITTCSGNGIKKIPLLGLSKYVKKKWWNEDYWAAGYDDVVRNNKFQKALDKSQPINAFTRVTGQKDFSLKELFDLGENELIALLQQEQTLWFTVTDDTFVMAPTLVVVYE